MNDLGGTRVDENISRAAGAEHGTGVSSADFRSVVEPLGRHLVQRTTLYGRTEGLTLPLATGRNIRGETPVAGP